MPLGQVRRVGRDLVRDDAVLDVLPVRQPQVFLGCDVAQHGTSTGPDHRSADRRGDVVVAGRDIRRQRAQRVERRLMTGDQLLVHVALDLVHRHMPRTFNHHLDIVIPSALSELTEGRQLSKLGFVVGIGHASRPQPVPQGKRYIVAFHDLADAIELGVEEVLLVVVKTPLGHDRAAAGNDPGDAILRERHVAKQHTSVNREIVDTLLRLLDQGLQKDIDVQVLHLALHFFEGLIDGHRTDRHRRVSDDPLTGPVDVVPGRQIHHRVRPPAGRPLELRHLLLDRRGHD